MTKDELLKRVAKLPLDKNGCKRWPSNIDSTGYARVKLGRVQHRAHRAVYEAVNGDVADEVFICHRCDVRDCVNPDHLFAGTHADNMADMKEKGRGRTPSKVGERNNSAKLNAQQVLAIRLALNEGRKGSELAREFGVTPTQVSRIKLKKRWTTA